MTDETTATPGPAADAQPKTGVTVQRPTIIGILYIANLFTGFSVLVGLVLAYVWRGEKDTAEWEKTHFTYYIYTFWIGFALFMLTFVGWFAVIFGAAAMQAGTNQPPLPSFFIVIFGGFFVWMLAAAWFVTRCILSLIKSGKREPMPRPTTWLF